MSGATQRDTPGLATNQQKKKPGVSSFYFIFFKFSTGFRVALAVFRCGLRGRLAGLWSLANVHRLLPVRKGHALRR